MDIQIECSSCTILSNNPIISSINNNYIRIREGILHNKVNVLSQNIKIKSYFSYAVMVP